MVLAMEMAIMMAVTMAMVMVRAMVMLVIMSVVVVMVMTTMAMMMATMALTMVKAAIIVMMAAAMFDGSVDQGVPPRWCSRATAHVEEVDSDSTAYTCQAIKRFVFGMLFWAICPPGCVLGYVRDV